MERVPHPDKEAVRFLQNAAAAAGKKIPVQSGDIFLRKMKTFAERMDMDRDGFLTRKDFQLLAERYAVIGKLSEVRAKQALKNLEMAWDTVFAPDAVDGKLSGATMTEALLRRGRDTIIAIAAVCFAFVFDVVDVQGLGAINLENFRLFHRISNILDEKVTEKAFQTLDEDKDGVLSLMEFVQAGIDYFVSDDENSPYNILYGPLVS